MSDYAFRRCCVLQDYPEQQMKTASEYAHLQARCRKILDGLRLPRPYSLESTVRWMENQRGRPLILKKLPQQAADAGACGLWLGTDDADFVFYESRTAPLHREHIILHELAHMLANHHHAPDNDVSDDQGADNGAEAGLGSLLSGLEPRLIKRLMMRTSYTTAEEQEAEMLASLMYSGQVPRSPGALGRLGALLGVRTDDRH